MKRIKSLALRSLLGLGLICAGTTAFGVEHPDGSFATPDGGNSSAISFKHIDNTNGGDYPYGYSTLSLGSCHASANISCVTDCTGVTELGAATLTSIPASDIAVSSLAFNTVGTSLTDATSNFCAILDGAGNVWAIDRDLPALSNITTANSSSRIIPCKITDIFSPVNGCYEVVTDGGVTAYRLQGSPSIVMFTDSPGDAPDSFNAPLGVGSLQDIFCDSTLTGDAQTYGLVCDGFAASVADSTCTANTQWTSNLSTTKWCLFSENPRTGGKAWAVKYVNGEIPTNDGASIVRCEGTDVFYPDFGCGALLPSQISIEGGFIKLDTTDGNAPFVGNCLDTPHYGRMIVDEVNDLLYICTQSGWISK